MSMYVLPPPPHAEPHDGDVAILSSLSTFCTRAGSRSRDIIHHTRVQRARAHQATVHTGIGRRLTLDVRPPFFRPQLHLTLASNRHSTWTGAQQVPE